MNRRALKTEKLLSSSPSRKSALNKCLRVRVGEFIWGWGDSAPRSHRTGGGSRCKGRDTHRRTGADRNVHANAAPTLLFPTLSIGPDLSSKPLKHHPPAAALGQEGEIDIGVGRERERLRHNDKKDKKRQRSKGAEWHTLTQRTRTEKIHGASSLTDYLWRFSALGSQENKLLVRAGNSCHALGSQLFFPVYFCRVSY